MSKNRRSDESHNNGLIITAAIGGILGAAAALFLTSKSGRDLRDKMYETYEDLGEKAGDYADELISKGKKAMNRAGEYADNLKEKARSYAEDYADDLQEKAQGYAEEYVKKGKKAMNRARDYAEDLRERTQCAAGECSDTLQDKAREFYENAKELSLSNNQIIVGAIALGVLSAAALAYSRSCCSSAKHDSSFADKIQHVDWMRKINQILDAVQDGRENFSRSTQQRRGRDQNPIDDFIDLASASLRTWKNFSSRR